MRLPSQSSRTIRFVVRALTGEFATTSPKCGPGIIPMPRETITAIIGALIYEAIANGPPTGAGAEPAATDYLDGILYVGFTIGGIIWCYLQNGGATGSDFLKRIVPIGWVMSWRYFALVIIFTAGLAAIRWQLTGETGRPEVESVWDVVVMNSLIMWLFWRMGIHMKWVADNSGAAQPSQ